MNTSDSALECVLRGEAPCSGATFDALTTGMDSLTNFLRDQYLREYIPLGGSKIKFATGRPGCGKTHFARLMLAQARTLGYLTASFSAREIWLHDFREIYLQILKQCDIEGILRDCADQITRGMGYDPAQIGEGRKSVAVSVTYRAEDRTLTDDEVDEVHGEILKTLRQQFGAVLRER
jgi:hypothetical protein